MKKLNLFAIGVVAMLVAITSVAAENVDGAHLQGCLSNDSTDVVKCTLTENVDVDTTDLIVYGTKTLDLGGHTLTLKNNKKIIVDVDTDNTRDNLTVTNGTIDATASTNYAFDVNGKGTLVLDGVTFKGNPGTNDEPSALIHVYNDGATLNITKSTFNNVIVKIGDITSADNTKNTNVTITDTTVNNYDYAITVNGNVKNKTNNIVLENNTFNATGDSSTMYAAGYANWTIKSGTYKGNGAAMSIRSGKFTIEDGTFEATGAYVGTPTNSSGSEVLGGAAITIGMSETNTVAGDVNLTINGGAFKAAEGAAIREVTGDSSSYDPAFESVDNAVTIKGGTFEGGTKAAVIDIPDVQDFVKGGTFIPANNQSAFGVGTTPVDTSTNKEYGYGEDAEGHPIIGKKYTVKVKNLLISVPTTTATGFGYSKPDTFEAVAGGVVNLLNELGITDEYQPDNRNNKYAVKYILTEVGTKTRAVGDKISGLTEFTMPESDIEIELEVVEVPRDTELGEQVVTPAPGTDTENQGGNQGSENQGSDKTDDDTENPNTLDNVTSVAAMGGISLAIAAAGIATLKKREN